MIGRLGSMIGSGGALASQSSRGGKIRPNFVVRVSTVMALPSWAFACPGRSGGVATNRGRGGRRGQAAPRPVASIRCHESRSAIPKVQDCTGICRGRMAAMSDTTVYFATNRAPEPASVGGFGARLADQDHVTYAVVPVTGTDLAQADSGTLGPITGASAGDFADTVKAEIETTGRNLLVFIHGFDN